MFDILAKFNENVSMPDKKNKSHVNNLILSTRWVVMREASVSDVIRNSLLIL